MGRTPKSRPFRFKAEMKILIDSLDYWPDFAVGPAGIHFVPTAQQSGPFDVSLLPFVDGRQVSVVKLPGASAQGLALSKDGRDLLLLVRSSIETNLIALERSNPKNF